MDDARMDETRLLVHLQELCRRYRDRTGEDPTDLYTHPDDRWLLRDRLQLKDERELIPLPGFGSLLVHGYAPKTRVGRHERVLEEAFPLKLNGGTPYEPPPPPLEPLEDVAAALPTLSLPALVAMAIGEELAKQGRLDATTVAGAVAQATGLTELRENLLGVQAVVWDQARDEAVVEFEVVGEVGTHAYRFPLARPDEGHYVGPVPVRPVPARARRA